jgi:hypothetical protein
MRLKEFAHGFDLSGSVDRFFRKRFVRKALIRSNEVAMTEVNIVKDGNNFFVVVDGVTIAQRGFPNSSQASPDGKLLVATTQTQSLSDIKGLTCISRHHKRHHGLLLREPNVDRNQWPAGANGPKARKSA